MLKAGFILLTVIIAIVMFAGVSYAVNKTYADSSKRNLFKIKAAFLLIAWLVYVSTMSYNGMFLDPALPPRIPLLLVLPCLVFIAWFFLSRRHKNIIAAIPLHWLTYFQTFRIIVELLIFGLFMAQMMPWSATFEGYNFDIGIGITAPLIGYLIAKGKIGRAAVRAWNFLGLLTLTIVAVIINTHAYRPWLFGETGTILGKGFGTFPFTFLAGFFLPSAIFVHILSLVKTGKKNSNILIKE